MTDAPATEREQQPAPGSSLLGDVLDTISDGVVVVDASGAVVLTNRPGAAMLGRQVRSVASDRWTATREVFREDGVTPLPPEQGPLARALTGVRSDRVPMWMRDEQHPDGVRLVVSARPLSAAAGVGTGSALLVFHDVTTATRLQERVVAEHERFGHLLRALSSIGEGVIIAEGRRVVFVNDAYAQLTGYSAEEFLTLSPDVLAGDDDTLADFNRWRGELESRPGEPAVMVSRVRHRDGHLIPVETVGVQVSACGVRQRISVNRDLRLTDRSRADMADTAAVLRTANRDLAVARDAADAASRAKSAFLTTMSHEIRTPLNAVVGLTELVLGTDLTGEQRDDLQTVLAGGEALLALVGDILDWSTIESGVLGLEQRPFGLRETIGSVVADLAPQVRDRDVELRVQLDPGCPEVVVGDAGRFRQVLVNLVGNAVKFTDRGHVLVTARVPGGVGTGSGVGPDGRRDVEVVVADSGIGIGRDQLPGVFRGFAQVDSSSTRAYGGSGLGLAISRRLAEHMGGTITATSEPGVGSVFTLLTRLGTAAPGEVAPEVTEPGALPGHRVLVVDDDPVDRRVLTAQIAGWGMHPDVATCAEEALAALRAGSGADRPDLVVLDLRVPTADALALLDQMAALPGAADLPVVMVTSGGDRAAVVAAVHPPDRQLTRPVRATRLRDTLATALGQAGARAAAREAAGRRPGPGEPAAVRHDMRVLVVEDNPVNRKVVELMLARLGCAADVAVNGRDAVDAVHRGPYDVILMDVQMPVLDGIEATAQLRRDPPAGPRPWIIALTASVLVEDRENCAAAGMDDYLNKPLHRAELAAALRRVPETAR